MYIYWLLIFFGSPILLFLLLDRKIVSENKKIFKKVFLGNLLFSVPCDFFGAYFGIWSWPNKLVGIYFLNLPLEEYLFIFMSTIILTLTTLWGLKHFKS